MDCFQILPRSPNKIDWFNDESNNLLREQQLAQKKTVLIDIVGATGLESKEIKQVNPYCKIQIGDKVVHRTDVIPNDGNPIWTVKSKSLCLLELPSCEGEEEDDNEENSSFFILVCHGNTTLGTVTLTRNQIQEYCDKSPGDRLEFPIQKTGNSPLPDCAVLACRMKTPSLDDISFCKRLYQRSSLRDIVKSSEIVTVNDLPVDERLVASDINFTAVNPKSIFQRYQKVVNGESYFRVQPYPDPERPQETEWMTEADIEQTAYEPSSKWVTLGSGKIGVLHLEVIGCDDLPNCDVGGLGDYTDAFCCMVFEDNYVRTDVIWDQLNPRWMPWTTRAFRFQIRHPASILFISVLDYDDAPLDACDPIGRVVIRLNEFRPNMIYTLHYPLENDLARQKSQASSLPTEGSDDDGGIVPMSKLSQGTLILRLQLQWNNESEAMKLFFTSPQRFIINVDNTKSLAVLRYTTRGSIDMDEVTLQAVKLYASEVLSYWKSYCYVLDVFLEICLWRGRWILSPTKSIWFPLRSVAMLVAAVTIIEHPEKTIPVLLLTIAWVLVTINYHAVRHPNPWKRVQPNFEFSSVIRLGRESLFSSSVTSKQANEIKPYQGSAEGFVRDKLDEMKASRMSALIQSLLYFLLKVKRLRKKTGDFAVSITTENRKKLFTFENRLWHVHLVLQMLVVYLRLGRDFLSWRSGYTAVLTSYCIMLAMIWMILPMNVLFRWLLRLIVWVCFGPWMKIIDTKYFRPWYATTDELLERIRRGNTEISSETDLPDFDLVLENETFYRIMKAGRIKAEELYKLKDMRILRYGALSESVPMTDNLRFPMIPLSNSTAVPSASSEVNNFQGYHIPGQHLSGIIIPSPETVSQYDRPCYIASDVTNGIRDNTKKNQ